MNEQQVIEKGNQLMDKYLSEGIHSDGGDFLLHYYCDGGWKFVVSKRLTSISGQCNMGKKSIQIASFHIIEATDEEVIDTILHEIAHAITGYKHDEDIKMHGKEWKKIAQAIGCTGERCDSRVYFKKVDRPYRWKYSCPICSQEWFDKRKSSDGCKCKKCDIVLTEERILS